MYAPPREYVRRMTGVPAAAEALTPVLVVEIECYLDAVALFRREGCEPHWRSCDDPGASGGLCQPARKTDNRCHQVRRSVIADRLEEAERQLLAGDIEGALQLLRRARGTAGTQRNAARLHAIADLAQRIESESGGPARNAASHFLFAARCDLAFAEKQDAFVRERVRPRAPPSS